MSLEAVTDAARPALPSLNGAPVTTPLLEARHLVKRFYGITVVDDVSFVVMPGEVVGYLGPNGSGKTTTGRMLTGLVEPSSGSVFFDGRNVSDDPIAYRRRLGYVPEEPTLYPFLSAREQLRLLGRLRELPPASMEKKMNALLELFGMADAAEQSISAYSKGMKQKVLIIAALLHDPDLLIFDEPDSGLDVTTTSLVLRHLVHTLAARGKAVLYSSHILEVVEKLCTRVIVLHRGRIVAAGHGAQLRTLMSHQSLEEVFAELVLETNPEQTAREIADVVAAVRERLLTQHFLQRFLENDLLSPDADRHEAIALVFGGLLTLGLFLSIVISMKFLFMLFPSPGRTALLAVGDRLMFVALAMIVMSLVAVMTWDALSLDARDTAIFGPLPMERGVIVRAKLRAVGILAGGFALAMAGMSSLFHPTLMVARLPIGIIPALALMVIHLAVTLAAGLFAFASVFLLREILRALLGMRFSRISAGLQAVMIVALVTTLSTAPCDSESGATTREPGGTDAAADLVRRPARGARRRAGRRTAPWRICRATIARQEDRAAEALPRRSRRVSGRWPGAR